MSAFIVEKETINKIITVISNIDHLKDRYILINTENKEKFGKKLLAMNYESVNQRYNENSCLDIYCIIK